MMKHLVEEVQVGISKGGHTVPVRECYVVAEARVRCPGENLSHWYSAECTDDKLHFFRTAESTFQIQMDEDWDHWEKVGSGAVGSCNEDVFYEDLKKHRFFDDGDDLIWGFLACLFRVPWDVMEQMKVECVGKYLEDIEYPPCQDMPYEEP